MRASGSYEFHTSSGGARSDRRFERECVEKYLADFRHGGLHPTPSAATRDQSMSIAAAHKAASVMYRLVEQFREREQAPDSPSKLALQHGEDAVKVATEQVFKLLHSVGRVGKGLQRAPVFRLLLGNVTHRVLSIVREAAAAASTTPQRLEEEAKVWLNSLGSTAPDGDGVNENDACDDDEAAVMDAPQTTNTASLDDDDDDDDDATDNSSMPRADSDPYADVELSGEEKASSSQAAASGKVKKTKVRRQPSMEDKTLSAKAGIGGLGKFGKNVTFPPEELGGIAASSASQPVKKSGIARSRPSEVEDAQSSSLSSDFLNTPPRQHVVLQRAPSVVGEEFLPTTQTSFPVRFDDFIDRALLGIAEFESVLEDMTTHLCENAGRQLNEKDIVVTLGVSHSTKHFLLRAAEDVQSGGKTFKVVLLESYGSTTRGAETLAATLRERNVEVSVLPDSSAFAVMGICSKVVIGCENVLANGGLLAPIGTHALCIAAKHFSVPVIVVTMTLKMTPYYPSDALCSSLVKISRHRSEEHHWQVYANPYDVLPLDQLHSVDVHHTPPMDTPSAMIEHVPADLISLFATNDGEYTVSQIHRIVKDNYNAED